MSALRRKATSTAAQRNVYQGPESDIASECPKDGGGSRVGVPRHGHWDAGLRLVPLPRIIALPSSPTSMRLGGFFQEARAACALDNARGLSFFPELSLAAVNLTRPESESLFFASRPSFSIQLLVNAQKDLRMIAYRMKPAPMSRKKHSGPVAILTGYV